MPVAFLCNRKALVTLKREKIKKIFRVGIAVRKAQSPNEDENQDSDYVARFQNGLLTPGRSGFG